MKLQRFLFVLLISLISNSAMSWQLSPEATEIERRLINRSQNWYEILLSKFALKGIHVIGGSVHEEITNRILGCAGDQYLCGAPGLDPDNAYFIAGVRWNDDPPFRFGAGQGAFTGCATGQTVRLITQPACWGSTFKDGEKRAGAGIALSGANSTLLVRSHFGDMQFLHAMATAEKEDPQVTKDKLMAWAEFTWRVSLGEYELDAKVWQLPISGFGELFLNNKEWRIQDLFALGNPHIRTQSAMSRVAFGSLLHLVQDSFSDGHVERRSPTAGRVCDKNPAWSAPGAVLEFHSYSKQDSNEHGKSDNRDSFGNHWSSDKPSVVDVGGVLHSLYMQKTPWETASRYIECVFTLDEDVRRASAGERYTKR